MRKHARSDLRHAAQALYCQKKLPESAPKPLTKDKSHADLINETRNLLWEAERYFPEAQRPELTWLRSLIETVFKQRSKRVLEKFSRTPKEVSRSIEIPLSVQSVMNLMLIMWRKRQKNTRPSSGRRTGRIRRRFTSPCRDFERVSRNSPNPVLAIQSPTLLSAALG
jgi:hypothetical protein